MSVLHSYAEGPAESSIVGGLNVDERHRGDHEERQSVPDPDARLRCRAPVIEEGHDDVQLALLDIRAVLANAAALDEAENLQAPDEKSQ